MKLFKTNKFPVLVMVLMFSCINAQAQNWKNFVDNFIESYFAFNPTFAVNAGRHDFDGKFPDWSAAGFQKQIAWLKKSRNEAINFKNFNSADNFERDYLISVVDGQLFWLEKARWQNRNPYFYMPAIDPTIYLSREYAPLEKRLESYISFAENIPRAAELIQKNLKTPMPKSYANLGAAAFKGYAEFYEKNVPQAFAEVKNEKLQTEMRTVNQAAAESLKKLGDWFETQKLTANENYALGSKLFQEMLQTVEKIDIPLVGLKKIALKNLAQDLYKLKSACAEFAPKKSERECVEIANRNKPKDGTVATAQRQVDELRGFLIAKNLVTVETDGKVLVEETPAYRRGNLAGIESPGYFDRQLPSIYSISPPDTSWKQEVQNAYLPSEAFLLFITVHEVYPGHFLHTNKMNRVASKIAQIFVGFGFSEGWAHYAEEMMWEEGLGNKSAEMRIGQLLLALMRDVRFIAAIGLQTGKMTVAQAEKMFIEAGFQDAGNARQQAIRGTFDPQYLIYTLGKIMILQMREKWFKKYGKNANLKDFHDKILSFGSPPLGLMQQAMFGK